MKHNGFVSIYGIGISAVILTLSVVAVNVSAEYIRLAKQYQEGIQLSYVSESAAYLAWDELRSRRWQDVPAKKTWKLEDEYGVAMPGQSMEIQCLSSPYQLPFSGTLRASAQAANSRLMRTCAVQFAVQAAADTEDAQHAVFSVTNICY